MALQFVLQKPIIHENLLHARQVVNVGNAKPLLLNQTVHYNVTGPNTLQQMAIHTVGKVSWSWLKYRQLGVSPLASAVSHLFGLTVLVAGVIYLALRLALFIRRDQNFQRRQMFKSKIKKMVFILTPLILLPGCIGAWFWERRFYTQAWTPGRYGAGGYYNLEYPGRYINHTLGAQALTDLSALTKSPYSNLTFESEALRKMVYNQEITIPVIRAASLDIVGFLVPVLVLISLVATIVGVFRYLTGRGQTELDEKTMA